MELASRHRGLGQPEFHRSGGLPGESARRPADDRGAPADGGLATAVTVSACNTAMYSAGNLVIAGEGSPPPVQPEKAGTYYGKRMKAGDVYAVAGLAGSAPIGDGGPATRAGLSASGIAIGNTGNLLIAHASLYYRVRLVSR